MLRIGLLGGTSWQSSAGYYRLLNEGVKARLGGKHSADLVLRSVDFAEVHAFQEAGDWEALGALYEAEAMGLRSAGAEVLGICANTMHLVHGDVVRGAQLPVVHVVDAVAQVAVDAGYERIALLGTRHTMASTALYPERMAARGIEVLVPDEDDAAEVDRIIYDELVVGVALKTSRQSLRAIVDRMVERGAQAVVLGCTELGMVLDPDDPTLPVPALDSLAVHVDALLDAAGLPQAESRESLEEGAA